MTESDALFIREKFHFNRLIGLNQQKLYNPDAEKSLYEREIIYDNNGFPELHASFRMLFSTWSKMRYSIVRPEFNSMDRFQALLANDKVILFIVRDGETFNIDFLDFSEEMLDKLVKAFAEITDIEHRVNGFNITMSVDEYRSLTDKDEEAVYVQWQKQLGIPAEVLRKYIAEVSTETNAQMLIVEDHEENVGYLGKIACREDGIYAIKHVTHEKDEKMVLAFGNSQDIINCIYNF